MARLKRFEVSGELLLQLGKGTYRVVKNELPDDCVIHSAVWDASRNVFVAIIEHDSFGDVHPSAQIPCVEIPVIEGCNQVRMEDDK